MKTIEPNEVPKIMKILAVHGITSAEQLQIILQIVSIQETSEL